MALREEDKTAPVGFALARCAPPAWASSIRRVTAWLTEDCLGGPRPWRLATVIDLQKGGTVAFLGILIWLYGNASPAAWIYLALHGGYGLVWLAKDLTFPDARWQKRITIAGGINAFLLVLMWYWVFGWLLISRPAPPHYPLPAPAWFALCIGLCVLGIALMIASDAQKYFTLCLGRRLITDGMFRFVRHPNYLGEMMIYGSFALMVWQALPFVVLALIWTFEFAVNIALIEASLSRYSEWSAYRSRTWLLLPGLL
jgi:protein-S-isoprenylcysteine O-methyltransferase Ste14